MKKILLGLLSLLTVSVFSACNDEDTKLAINLSGEWEGNFGAYYTISIKGSEPITYQTRSTNLVFEPRYEYAKDGTGFEIDYYDKGPYDYLRYDFKWKVKNGVISLMYLDVDDMDIDIDHYDMDSEDFWGYINGVKFHLNKISSHYDWDTFETFSHREDEDVETDHDMTRASMIEVHPGHLLK